MSEADNRVWDVLIVGAGPAGSLCAISLARLGYKTLLLEKKSFPREKACGGCLSSLGVEILRRQKVADALTAADPLPLSQMQLRSNGIVAKIKLNGTLALDRKRFDLELVKRAVEAGAVFLDRSPVTLDRPFPAPDYATVTNATTGRTFCGKVLIWAGGLASLPKPFAESCGSIVGAHAPIGASCSVPAEEPFENGVLYMATAGLGYVGLVHSTRDTLHIGAALRIWKDGSRALPINGLVEAILRNNGLAVPAGLARARFIGTSPLTRHLRRVADQRLFVIGDAAGYTEPFTGQGMSWALLSGELAAKIAARAVVYWDDTLPAQWQTMYEHEILSRQKFSSVISAALQHQKLFQAALRMVASVPALGRLATAKANHLSR